MQGHCSPNSQGTCSSTMTAGRHAGNSSKLESPHRQTSRHEVGRRANHARSYRNLLEQPELVGTKGLWQHAEVLLERAKFNV